MAEQKEREKKNRKHEDEERENRKIKENILTFLVFNSLQYS